MVILLKEKRDGNTILFDYQGESTDEKPTLSEIYTGSTFFCVDNGSAFVWHIDVWREV